MIRIGNLSLPVDGDFDLLRGRAARALGVRPGALGELEIVRQSIDARDKGSVRYVYTVELSMPNEEALVKRAPGRGITLTQRVPYDFPAVSRRSSLPPVVVGMGPAGLFAALFLARNGLPCVVLERGQDVDRRTLDVGRFWETGALDESSNVQFGEGGAGTFSDGKLTTGTHDRRISAVLDALVEAGAPADVRYSHRPHIGTDVLREVVRTIRQELISLGCDVRFGHRLTGLTVSGGALTGIEAEGPQGRYSLAADALILAPGHSARDTFAMLREAGVPMEQKKFAVGVRLEHRQRGISLQQYGPLWEKLPPSDYKLACHLPDGRSAFTFCVCPGGQVVAAASERGGLVTNGMSRRARDGENINGGLLVGVGPEDFPGDDPLAGVRFQEQWERSAFRLGGGGFQAPAQRVEDFLRNRPSEGAGAVAPTYRPGITWTDLRPCLPGYVTDTLAQALPLLDRKLRGFAAPDAVLTGVETRSSSPVRVLRDNSLQSPLRGLYPCGEGAGYAGGIVSAAVDGIRVAEAVAKGAE
ncbi:FAD-binding protein [Colidextribacter sp. OB.20]|uniref:NAD(P)/FAD-dependent oxidoreductase n=1 Tax=Colidextribacter sp. OB.20 TaxID=2304568 RepID=UPI00136E75BA|nr:FAD-binding protein [Colidextribacter sp. OB.20]NBI09054.1 FAD-binding protein [Colidextribacter sp. OB.20]